MLEILCYSWETSGTLQDFYLLQLFSLFYSCQLANATGRDTVKQLPISSWLVTIIVPLCLSIIAWVMANPKPDPP